MDESMIIAILLSSVIVITGIAFIVRYALLQFKEMWSGYQSEIIGLLKCNNDKNNERIDNWGQILGLAINNSKALTNKLLEANQQTNEMMNGFIETLATRMEEVIRNQEEYLKDNNDKLLEKVVGQYEKSCDNLQQAITGGINANSKSMRMVLDRNDQELKNIEAIAQNILQSSGEICSNISGLTDKLLETNQQANEMMNGFIVTLTIRMEEFIRNQEGYLKDNNDKLLEKAVGQYEKSCDNLQQAITGGINANSKSMRMVLDRNDQELKNIEAIAQNILQSSGKICANISDFTDKVKGNIEEMGNVLCDANDAAREAYQTVGNDINAAIGDITGDINNSVKKIARTNEETVKEFSEYVEKLIRDSLDKIVDSNNSAVQKLSDEMSLILERQSENINEFRKANKKAYELGKKDLDMLKELMK